MKINNRLKIGIVIVGLFVLGGFILPIFCTVDPSLQGSYMDYAPVSWEHLLGTDALGRDIGWYLVFSIRNSLILGVTVAICTTAIALVVGLSAGFSGGRYDRVMMMINDSFIVIPAFPILIILNSLVKGHASQGAIIAILVLFGWAWSSRTIRSIALSVREREFINMAWFSGCSRPKIIFREVFPHVFSYAVVGFINSILWAINTEASLAVLGLSSVERPTLGAIVYWANTYSAVITEHYIWIGAPILATVLIFLGLFLTSTGYNQYFAERRGHS
jgi:peptide/nickel transport system permease protein